MKYEVGLYQTNSYKKSSCYGNILLLAIFQLFSRFRRLFGKITCLFQCFISLNIEILLEQLKPQHVLNYIQFLSIEVRFFAIMYMINKILPNIL